MQRPTNSLRVTAIQSKCTEDSNANLERALAHIEQAAEAGADVVCLQELFATHYFCQSEEHQHFNKAETIPGPTSDALSKKAKERQIVIVAGIFERRAPGLFHNSAIVLDTDGQLAGLYRKMHIPDDPFFYEKFYFTPGDLGFRSFDTALAKIGVCVCWDQWFPEAARLTSLQGAQLLVYPTAIGWLDEDRESVGENQLNAWQTMLRSHAIANGLFVVAPNRVGQERHIQFWGSSFICDPYGNLLAEAPRDEQASATADCDFSLIESARTQWPFLRDRRIDAYKQLTARWID